MQDVEESLLLAVLAAECLYGEARVRLDAGYSISEEKHALVVDAGTDIGRSINRIFTGFVTREFGEDAFKVERLKRNKREEADR